MEVQSLIQKGIVLDKLMESVIVQDGVHLDDLLLGDKNAIMIATRILGYGKDYSVELVDPDTPNFREFAVKLPGNAADAVAYMDSVGVLGGFPMGDWWESMSSCLLIGCDERTTKSDIDALVSSLSEWVEEVSA